LHRTDETFGVSELNPNADRSTDTVCDSTETDSAIVTLQKITQITTSNYGGKIQGSTANTLAE